jgi:hypothetical protein
VTHPSGKPIRHRIVKRVSDPTGTSPGYYNARLNTDAPREDLPGGFGFVMVRQAEDDDTDVGAFETVAKRRNH